MSRLLRIAVHLFISLCVLGGTAAAAAQPSYPTIPPGTQDASAIVRGALDQWRGSSSYAEMTMTIHRPDWERSMSMRAWTKGDKHSLVRVVAPAKDAGNGTLIVDNDMWSYSPKINRVIKMPSSMMGQSWMGSDFSNQDISRADDILEDYQHRLLEVTTSDGHRVYHIEATPQQYAAVVWGREVMLVRDDYMLLQHDFYDQDDQLIKRLKTLNIAIMDGRPVAAQQRMAKLDTPEEWTQIRMETVDFNIDISDRLFTLSNLRNPRE